MPDFKCEGISVNSGNNPIGKLGCEQIQKEFKEKKLDFMTINCQEAEFDALEKQLQTQLGPNFGIMAADKMPTHTKWKTLGNDKYGITTYVVYDRSKVDVALEASKVVRRDPEAKGTPFNKGGVYSIFKITSKTDPEKTMRLETSSCHFDSKKEVVRDKDANNMHKAKSVAITDRQSLIRAHPDMSHYAGDFNTRDPIHYTKDENLWKKEPDQPAIQAIHRVNMGAQSFSGPNTYKTHKGDKNEEEISKRPGLKQKGSLDIVHVATPDEPGENSYMQLAEQVGRDPTTERDHDVVISQAIEYTCRSPFEVVRGQMANKLVGFSAKLANEIRAMPDNDDNWQKLQEIHQKFLNPEGLLNQALDQHNQKLQMNKNLSKVVTSNLIKAKLTRTLFEPAEWFQNSSLNSSQEQQKLKMMECLLTKLDKCKSEKEVDQLLDSYNNVLRSGVKLTNPEAQLQAQIDKENQQRRPSIVNQEKPAKTSIPEQPVSSVQKTREKVFSENKPIRLEDIEDSDNDNEEQGSYRMR